MTARRATKALPLREGIDPVRIHTRMAAADVETVGDLVRRRWAWPPGELEGNFDRGLVVDSHGHVLKPDDSPKRTDTIWTYREPAPEVPVPDDIEIRYQDERIVIVDKPHFLATTPRAGHVRETVLVRLRNQLGIDSLACAHRLDRLTAGLVLLTIDPAHRGAYQKLFADRRVDKTYHAVAPLGQGQDAQWQRRSRIVKHKGSLQAYEVPGPENAVTDVSLLGRCSPLKSIAARAGLYELRPHTGKTHQLRLHMAAAGLPILGDDLYPEISPYDPSDFSDPLQLLAYRLAFCDPISGYNITVSSKRRLKASGSFTEENASSAGPFRDFSS